MKFLKIGIAMFLMLLIVVGYTSEEAQVATGHTAGFPVSAATAAALKQATPRHIEPPKDGWTIYDPPSKMRPRLYAQAACVVDFKSSSVLYSHHGEDVRPIASITKLLTALVYLDAGGTFDQEIQITPEDAKGAGKSILWKNHRFKARDVFYTALLSSDNRAARGLARSTTLTPEQFIERMNEKARQIGCLTLSVEEPTGLSEQNVASAVDVARLLSAALANPAIRKVCQTYRHQFMALNSKKLYRIHNTNRMLLSKYSVAGGKTGYIEESGWCLANMIDTEAGPIAAVVLGTGSNSSRFTQVRRLTDWGLKYRTQRDKFSILPAAAAGP